MQWLIPWMRGDNRINGIIITEKNFHSIAGRLVKFFNGKDIIQWHSFNCGMKRHIPTDFIMDIGTDEEKKEERVKCVYRYSCVSASKSISPVDGTPIIIIRLIKGSACVIRLGDVVRFCGNRVQLKQEFIGDPKYKWIYTTYQLWDENGGLKDIKPEHEDYFYDEMWDY